MSSGGYRWRSALATAAVLAAAGCTTATPNPDGGYQQRTQLAVDDATSHVRTTEKVLQASMDGKFLGTYALTTVRASDDTLGRAVGAYTELYPPEPLDPLFTRANRLLGEAADLVGESRIALYRGDRHAYPRLVARLDELAKKLERFSGALS